MQAASDDPARFTGVRVLGVDEHVWHHQDRRRRGPRELTGIVDLTRGEDHPTARLLDLVPGRSGTVHENWLEERGEDFPSGIQIATLDPFQGYKNAIDDQLQDTTSVLDAFHIVKLAGDAPGEVRRRVQQDTLGHRGRKGDPLYQIRLLLRASRDRLTKRQQERLREAFTADEAHISVKAAYRCAQQVREVFHQDTPTQGQRPAARLIQRLPTCPIPEIARLGRTLRKWKDAFLAYFDTDGASNAPHGSHQRNHRAGQTHRQRLPQPHQLPTPNAPHRRRPRRLHPHSTLKSL
ncbi:transposase [Actinomyces sp. oral taxon 172 str. F0311]|nr:transposase [Actinomyces sp. oral taxon 172 str. F0311]